uniref:Hypothetical conjugal transfer protein n=1 Tax=Vibrio sp. 23023 TaxID=452803 RepID=A9M4S9_9VIBR|nr:TrbI/VirB10 family protein [Vibrio sp. 23023]ABX77028.1 Hypothetical conjugal transfer protein [Vibrio sp. 23023]
MSNAASPPLTKKKLTVYLMASVGLITAVLFVMTVIDMANRKATPTDITPTEASLPQEQSAQKPSDIEQLVDEKMKVSSPELSNAKGNDQHLASTDEDEAIATLKTKMKLKELERASLALHSTWRQENAPPAPTTAPPPSPSTSEQQLQTLEARRMETQRRIEQVTQLKEAIESQGGFSIDSKKLASLQKQFTPPPHDVVGYTKSNAYNADITGKMVLPIGTVIPALTTTKSVSDYAGTFKGIVAQDIYDVNYQYVLIPKGSEVIMKSMKVSNVNEVIQERMGIMVQWIVLPNGTKIDMSKASGLDREGVGAIKDQVNRHLMAQFMGVAAYALLSSSTSYEGSGANNDNSYVGDIGNGVREQAKPLAKQYLNLRPTITIRAGQSMNIITGDDIYLSPWKSVYQDYH